MTRAKGKRQAKIKGAAVSTCLLALVTLTADEDRPRRFVVTADDGTTTTNVIHDDGTVTGWVDLPNGQTFTFPTPDEVQ